MARPFLPTAVLAPGDESDQPGVRCSSEVLGALAMSPVEMCLPLWHLGFLDPQRFKLGGWKQRFPKEVTGSDPKQGHSCFHSWGPRLMRLNLGTALKSPLAYSVHLALRSHSERPPLSVPFSQLRFQSLAHHPSTPTASFFFF